MVEKVQAEITFEEKKALKAINSVTDALENFAKKAEVAGRRFDKSFKRTERTVKETKKATDKLGVSVLDMAKGFIIGNLAVNAASRAIETLKDFARDLVVEFIAIEKAEVGVAKTTNLTARDMARLSENIKTLSTRVPIATVELLNLAAAGGQLGVRGVANLTKFTETMAKLSVATDIVGQEGARSIVRILTVTGDGVSTVDRFGSAITGLGNDFAATESQILAVSTRVARSTVQFELGAINVLGISTALAAMGVQAEAGGTAIGKAFKSIEKTIDKGGTRFKRLAELTELSGDALKKAFSEDKTKVFRLFIEGLGKIEKSKLTQTLEQMGLKGERVSSVLATLATRSEVLGRAIDSSNALSKENTALNKESAQAFDTLGSKLKITSNLLSKMAQEAFGPVGESIKKATELMNDFLKRIDKSKGSLISLAKVAIIPLTADASDVKKAFITLVEIASVFNPSLAVLADRTTLVKSRLRELEGELKKAKQEFALGKGPIDEQVKSMDELRSKIELVKDALAKDSQPLLIKLGRPLGTNEFIQDLTDIIGERPLVVPVDIQVKDEIKATPTGPDPLSDADKKRIADRLERERKLQIDLDLISAEADLRKEEKGLILSEAKGEATELELQGLRDVETIRINIVADAARDKALLIKDDRERELTLQKINGKQKADIDKKNTKDAKKLIKDKQDFERLSAQQSISLASNTGNFINAIAGEQTKAGFLLSKVAATASVVVAHGIATAQATAAAAGAAATSGAAAPAVFALTLAQLEAVITANTALSLGTIAATTIQGFQGGGILPGTPNPLGRDTTLFAGSPGEVILNKAGQGAVAGAMTNDQLLSQVVERLDVLIAKDQSIQIDGREIARTVQDETRSGFDISA